MKYIVRRPSISSMGKQVAHPTCWVIFMLAVWCFVPLIQAEPLKPDIYVPYEDLAHLIDPADKAVLMDRAEFETLLAAAEATARASETIELGQVRRGEYLAEVTGDTVTLTGTLQVVSLGKGPVAVPLGFAKIGLTRVVLDDGPAPLGYDEKGRLTLIVPAKGEHRIEVEGTTKLEELSSGGMQFGVSLPAAAAGHMKLGMPGDIEVHATVPILQSHYDKPTDRTDAALALGGRSQVTVVLLGNGRQQEDRAILLGESATTVHLTRSHQVLGCLFTVQALRRGTRELEFQLPAEWTITEVTCPDLVKWSVDMIEEPQALKTLTVRLRSEKVGTTVLHIKASAPVGQPERTENRWHGPRVRLVDASYQRGYMMVSIDEGLSVRAEALADARREDVSAMASLPGMVSGPAGRLYFHWGRNWSLNLELATVELRRSIKERQNISVSPEKVTLKGDFEVTAIGRELFDMSFVLSPQWKIGNVQVNTQESGFEYRVVEQAGQRLLHIELPRPIRPEKVANVTIELQHVPSRWHWPSGAAARSITVPLIESRAQTVSGDVLVSALDDLDALPQNVPDDLDVVPVGRMVSLGIRSSVQYAYSYNQPMAGQIELQVSRRRPRISGYAVGLVTVNPHESTNDWRITYTISRASARRLYLLVDKSLGEEIEITSATVPISSKSIIALNQAPMSLSNELTRRYNLWLLNLDHKAFGDVVIDVHYEYPRVSASFEVPLVRAVCDEQSSEHVAIQASEDLALTMNASQAKEIDAIDLPPLPVQADRVLGAFRLDSVTTAVGSAAAITLETAVHENYEIPTALATSVELTTYLDIQGGQRTEAKFDIVNAGQQFLTIRLPDGAELWSLRVGDQQVKPQQGTGGDYQVALGLVTKPINVKVVYTYQPDESDLEQLSLGGVDIPGVKINKMSWMVIPPPDYVVTSQATKMQSSNLIRPVPAFVQVYDAFIKRGFFSPVLMPSLSRVRRSSGRPSRELAFAEVESETQSEERHVQMGGMGGYVDRGAPPPSAVASIPVPTKPQEGTPVQQKVAGIRLAGRGRRTLPVDLVATPGGGPQVRFTGFGESELVIGLTNRTGQMGRWALGLILIAAVGTARARRTAKSKVILIFVILFVTSLLALWLPAATDFANGAFTAGAALIPLYMLIALVQCLWNRLVIRWTTI